MKKILLSALLLLCLAGCNVSQPTSVDVDPSPTQSAQAENTQKITVSQDAAKYESMNLYQECEYSITGADNEVVKLFTDALKDDENMFMWDDSHNWALVVENSNGVYPLYSEYTHAIPSMNVSEYYTDNKVVPVIRLIISSSASFEIREYRFDGNSFSQTVPYSSGALNELPIIQY